MDFEFDAGKSAKKSNEKHGVDFEEAQAFWANVTALELPAQSEAERREALITRHSTKLWNAILIAHQNNFCKFRDFV